MHPVAECNSIFRGVECPLITKDILSGTYHHAASANDSNALSFAFIRRSLIYEGAIILGLSHFDNSLLCRNLVIPINEKSHEVWDGANDENRTHVTALRRQRNSTIRH